MLRRPFFELALANNAAPSTTTAIMAECPWLWNWKRATALGMGMGIILDSKIHKKERIFENEPTLPLPLLSRNQIAALSKLDHYWHLTPPEAQWERRYCELIQYWEQFGDCCVPISFQNKKLANWVSTQRKQYNLRQSGKKSGLTDEQLEHLEAVGFVWNRWEHKFAAALNQGDQI